MSAWVLPDDVSDILPSTAHHIEALRRRLQDTSASFGYELVIPPLVEYLESLLSGSGETLNLQTFKLIDQMSGRSIGVRADSTPQVARIDAHFLNRQGITRLSYAGPVLHTRADRPYATREPLQFGAEIYGHAGLEADLEVMSLALSCLQTCKAQSLRIDIADVRVVNALLAPLQISPHIMAQLQRALSAKDLGSIQDLSQTWPRAIQTALMQLTKLYGGSEVLNAATKQLPQSTLLQAALDGLHAVQENLHALFPEVAVGFDLADLQGYAYYTGIRFAIYAHGIPGSLARGGRYDEIGAIFGRKRPAAGFSLDIKELANAVPITPLKVAIRAPFGTTHAVQELQAAIAQLRQHGETVIAMLPGHKGETQEFSCDRELIHIAGKWVVKATTAN